MILTMGKGAKNDPKSSDVIFGWLLFHTSDSSSCLTWTLPHPGRVFTSNEQTSILFGKSTSIFMFEINFEKGRWRSPRNIRGSQKISKFVPINKFRSEFVFRGWFSTISKFVPLKLIPISLPCPILSWAFIEFSEQIVCQWWRTITNFTWASRIRFARTTSRRSCGKSSIIWLCQLSWEAGTTPNMFLPSLTLIMRQFY